MKLVHELFFSSCANSLRLLSCEGGSTIFSCNKRTARKFLCSALQFCFDNVLVVFLIQNHCSKKYSSKLRQINFSNGYIHTHSYLHPLHLKLLKITLKIVVTV